MAAILAGAVDVATDQSDLSIDGALELERRWQGTTGNQVRYDPNGALGNLQIQYREEYARPRNGFTDRNVRQAFYQALGPGRRLPRCLRMDSPPSRTAGITPITRCAGPSSLRSRNSPTTRIEPSSYWRRRAGFAVDGILVHQQTGERFSIRGLGPGERSRAVGGQIVDNWKAAGAQMTVNSVPAALAGGAGRESQAKRPGPRVGAFPRRRSPSTVRTARPSPPKAIARQVPTRVATTTHGLTPSLTASPARPTQSRGRGAP